MGLNTDGRAIIVLGAARSGTRVLRDAISASSSVRTIPYDVNYVWRWGQAEAESDVLDAARLSETQAQEIRAKLWAICQPKDPSRRVIVEKTVANVLRIPYVLRVFPKAQYVYILRDGRDVVESSMRSWRRSSDLKSLWPKVKTFPWLRSYRYALRYVNTAVHRRLNQGKRVRTWGPVYPGMDNDARALPLIDVCAKQWLACVRAFETHRNLLPTCHVVRYEELVRDPSSTTRALVEALSLPDGRDVEAWARSNVIESRVGRYDLLPTESRARLESLLAESLASLGFTSRG